MPPSARTALPSHNTRLTRLSFSNHRRCRWQSSGRASKKSSWPMRPRSVASSPPLISLPFVLLSIAHTRRTHTHTHTRTHAHTRAHAHTLSRIAYALPPFLVCSPSLAHPRLRSFPMSSSRPTFSRAQSAARRGWCSRWWGSVSRLPCLPLSRPSIPRASSPDPFPPPSHPNANRRSCWSLSRAASKPWKRTSGPSTTIPPF